MATVTRVRMFNFGVTHDLTVLDCSSCGVIYAISSDFEDRRRQDHRQFFCPNGHGQAFSSKSREEELRERLVQQEQVADEARRKAQREREARQRAERSTAAYKGQLTKTKKRIANGVCPCCNRSFVNVHRHMKSQHPDFVEAP